MSSSAFTADSLIKEYPMQLAVFTGVVAVAAMLLLRALTDKGASKKASVALDPTQFQSFKLVKKTIVSNDTRIFRFALHREDQILGLPIGQHMYLKATIDGAEVQRAYTPISSDDDKGYFDLLIKVYFKNVHPKFPEGGKLTQHIEGLAIGESILVKGPSGRFEYTGRGKFTVRKTAKDPSPVTRSVKKMAMIAGGSGITPMMQIIRAVLKDPKDTTELYLVFGNQTEEDILMRKDIDACVAQNPRLKVWYTIDRPTAGWQYGSGFITQEMLEKQICPAGSDAVVLMCGPPPMINFACKPNLEKMGYTAEQMFTF